MLVVVVLCVHATFTSAAACFQTFSNADYTSCRLVSPSYAAHWKLNGDKIRIGVAVDGKPGWIGECSTVPPSRCGRPMMASVEANKYS